MSLQSCLLLEPQTSSVYGVTHLQFQAYLYKNVKPAATTSPDSLNKLSNFMSCLRRNINSETLRLTKSSLFRSSWKFGKCCTWSSLWKHWLSQRCPPAHKPGKWGPIISGHPGQMLIAALIRTSVMVHTLQSCAVNMFCLALTAVWITVAAGMWHIWWRGSRGVQSEASPSNCRRKRERGGTTTCQRSVNAPTGCLLPSVLHQNTHILKLMQSWWWLSSVSRF